ncbi:hypothetical protein QTP88_023389 [Uroleucon formosanum]
MKNQYLCCTKEEVRTVIRFFNFQNISPTEIHRKITEVYGPQVMSRKSVLVWCTKFNSGRESVEDEARSGRPISTSTAETIDAVEKLLRSDRRLKIREMVTQLDLPKTTVHEIVHEKLNFRKVSGLLKRQKELIQALRTQPRIHRCHPKRAGMSIKNYSRQEIATKYSVQWNSHPTPLPRTHRLHLQKL